MKFLPQHFLPAVVQEPSLISIEDAARIANLELEKHIETLPVVYGHKITSADDMRAWVEDKQDFSDQVARLICIEEIKPCTHGEIDRDEGTVVYRCGFCGKRVRPKNGWETVDE